MTAQLFKIISSPFFGIDARRLLCIAQFICALLESKTTNLKRLCQRCRFNSNGLEARYRRLQRLISGLPLTQEMLATWIVSFIPDPLDLAIDRTNWKFGSFEVNILTLGVLYKGFCIPLFWKLIPHKGCSAFEDRKDLIERFITVLKIQKIGSLVADREFVGFEWLDYLDSKGIEHHIRLNNNVSIGIARGEFLLPVKQIQELKEGEKIHLPGRRKITSDKKHSYRRYVSACRSLDGELVIIISNKNPEAALCKYKKRWGIECLFSALKTRGFDLEETHLNQSDRISNLFLLLSMAFFCAILIGNWLNETAPIVFKTHERRAVSIFRYGLDALCIVEKEFIAELLAPLLNIYPKPPSKELLFSIRYT